MAIRKLSHARPAVRTSSVPLPKTKPPPRREGLEPNRPKKVALEAVPKAPALLPSAGLSGVVEYYEGTHHAESERTPRDAQYLTLQRVRVPKLADFALDGLSKLEKSGHTPIYDRDVEITRPDGTKARINLMRASNDSVPVDDFYLALEEILRAQVFPLDREHAEALGLAFPGGADHVNLLGTVVLQAIDTTIAEAVRLAEKVPPEAAPIPDDNPKLRAHFLTMLKRFAIQAVFHSRDLTTVHVAMGHDPKKEKQLDETLRHDLVEPAPLKDLVWQLERRPHEPWMEAWVRAEVQAQAPELLKSVPEGDARALFEVVKANDGLTFNCSALNPRNLVAMFRWGDSREDCNVLIDPHRLSPHHNGSSKTDVDFQQRAINFLSHHMPREHMGVRHEQRGEWDTKGPGGEVVPFGKLELAFETDRAISGSTVLQAIAREGARFFRAAEEKGFTVPWQKLKVPNGAEFVQLDHAYQTLQANNRAADDLYATQRARAEAGIERVGPAAALRAEAVLAALDGLGPSATAKAVESLEASVAELLTGANGPQERELAGAVALAAVAKLTQLSPSSVAATDRFVPVAEAIEDALYAFEPKLAPEDGRLFIGAEVAHDLRARLEELPAAAKAATAEKDASTALVYQSWNALLTGGFASIAH